MQLHHLSNYLAGKFTLDSPCYSLDDAIVCHTFDFQSDISPQFAPKEWFRFPPDGAALDSGEKENQKFRFAVIAPVQPVSFSEAIILLHGLNERNWRKYLPWAYQLALLTQKPVVMFPIAFHINRSPLTWHSPRLMNQLSNIRRAALPEMINSSFANVALSIRLDYYPKLFPLSGIQTYFDLIKLTSCIKAGHFNLFQNGCKIHFFAYSIGALLTEVLLISNPLQLFSDSRAFFFCGGSTFDKINGSSRAIMDSRAFISLKSYMLNHPTVPKKEIKIPERHEYLLHEGWKAFLAMSGITKYGRHRENAFKHLTNRVKAIGLAGDDVVPGQAIRETFGLNASLDVDILDFPFSYSHEAPFPMNDPKQKDSDSVDQSFRLVFKKASMLFM